MNGNVLGEVSQVKPDLSRSTGGPVGGLIESGCELIGRPTRIL